jgi:exodeoxyribonuclease VII small subunit
MSDISFEKALAELEKTVEKLEDGRLPLDESLAFFEKGIKLAEYLRAELEKAEKKIEILLQDDKGKVKPEAFELKEKKEAVLEKPEEPETGENNDLPF